MRLLRKILTHKQKEAIKALSMGALLESFDFMLYLNISLISSSVFFIGNPTLKISLLACLSFCLPYIFKIFNLLLIYWIERKEGIEMTTLVSQVLGAASYILLFAVYQSYETTLEAVILALFFRFMQSLVLQDDLLMGQLYFYETFKTPLSYSLNTLLLIMNTFGNSLTLFCLLMVNRFPLVIPFLQETHIPIRSETLFFLGAIICAVGHRIRNKLRSTYCFVKINYRLAHHFKKLNFNTTFLKKLSFYNKPSINYLVFTSYLFVESFYLLYFCFVYFYTPIILYSFGLTPTFILLLILLLSLLHIGCLYITYILVQKIHPLKIFYFKLPFLVVLTSIFILSFKSLTSPYLLFCFQALLILLIGDLKVSLPLFAKYIPSLNRYSCLMFSSLTSKLVIVPFMILKLQQHIAFLNLKKTFLVFLLLHGIYGFILYFLKQLELKHNSYIDIEILKSDQPITRNYIHELNHR